MAPTILVIGATGNTGKSVVRNLPKLLSSSKSSYQIVGLTRSLNSSVSKKLAELPGVEMREKDWTTIEGTHTDGDGGDNELWEWEEVK